MCNTFSPYLRYDSKEHRGTILIPNVFKIFLACCIILFFYVHIQGIVCTFQYNTIYISDLRSSKMLRSTDW